MVEGEVPFVPLSTSLSTIAFSQALLVAPNEQNNNMPRVYTVTFVIVMIVK